MYRLAALDAIEQTLVLIAALALNLAPTAERD